MQGVAWVWVSVCLQCAAFPGQADAGAADGLPQLTCTDRHHRDPHPHQSWHTHTHRW